MTRLGRNIWKKWSEYDQRSLVWTKLYGFELLRQRVSARTFKRQVT